MAFKFFLIVRYFDDSDFVCNAIIKNSFMLSNNLKIFNLDTCVWTIVKLTPLLQNLI